MARLNDTMSQQFQSSEIFIPLSPAEPQPCYLFGFILFLCFSSVNVSCIFPNVFFFFNNRTPGDIINPFKLCTNLRPHEIEIKFFIKQGNDPLLYIFVCLMLVTVH